MATPKELSQQLREGDGDDLKARRRLVALSLLGLVAGQIVALYQIGILKKLPDPPLSIFDSSKVNASDYAYKRFQTPDAFMMLITYAFTAFLAGAGEAKRAEKTPILPILMGGKILIDVLTNMTLAREEWQENQKFCAYCQSANLISLISLVIAWPEVKKALFGRR